MGRPELEIRETRVATHHPCPLCGEDTRDAEDSLDVFPVRNHFSVCFACAERYAPAELANCEQAWSFASRLDDAFARVNAAHIHPNLRIVQ